MKNVQLIFNIQVPDHISEQEVSTRLHQVIGSILDQEYGLSGNIADPFSSSCEDHDHQIGHA